MRDWPVPTFVERSVCRPPKRTKSTGSPKAPRARLFLQPKRFKHKTPSPAMRARKPPRDAVRWMAYAKINNSDSQRQRKKMLRADAKANRHSGVTHANSTHNSL